MFAGILLSFAFGVHAPNRLEIEKIRQGYNLVKLEKIQQHLKTVAKQEKKLALQIAKQRGWEEKIFLDDGRMLELQKVDNGKPIYYTTFNVDAARSTRTDHLHSGGSLGLNLMGQGMTAYVWDGGGTRITHQEFDGAGGTNRVSIIDGSTLNGNSFHAQHVTGTIVASGVQANAKGMAPYAQARTADWNNDKSEATSQASNGMLLSNHSYGYAFRNQFGQVQLPQHYFGGYITESRDWDEIMFNAPNYLMVVAAGNDGNDNTANQNPTGGSGWDKLTGHSTSKNNLVVANAQDANIDAAGNLVSVSINSSSSEGPTDDFRIKPDITGNGTGVYSTYDNSDTAYNSITGTSMASPNVTGSLLLLQQHYKNLNSGAFMRAATLKGIALHTADDAGASGPDAVFGWGLLNTKRAAEAISNNGNQSKIEELTLNSGQSYTVSVESDGVSPLLASISWTDRPGTANTIVNSTTPVLVNDLDIRITKGSSSYLPYKLTSPTTSAQQDNNVDPYERVDITGATGTYTITVTHKGSLTGGSQNFSLIVTGLTGTPVVCNATTPTGVTPSAITSSEATISWDAVPGTTYDIRYRQTGTTNWATNAVSGTSTTLSGLSATTEYEVQVRSKCSDGSNSNYSTSVNFTTTAVQLNYCASQGNSVADEYIGRVQIGTIDNSSGSGNGYSDHTAISTDLSKGSSATITVTPTWTGTIYSEGYSVWIDYNRDGDFTDAGEQVWTQSATTASSVSGSFTVSNSAAEGATRMRVSMKYNGIPTSCETFSYGEVEDYTVNITGSGGGDTQAPTAPTNLVASNIAETTATLTWTASTDNVGVTGYDVYQGSSNIGTVTGTTANITGLTANTSYTFTVRAKDAAGNESAASNEATFTTSSGADTDPPTAPTNLTASNITQTTATLSWTASTDNVGVTEYEVFNGGTSVTTVTGTSTEVTGLTANTSYTFTVRAKDAAGNVSGDSNPATFTTQSAGGGSTTTLHEAYFETGWDGWIDGGSDCYRDNDTRSFEGNYSIRLRDNSGTASAMTSQSFNLSGYDSVEFKFYFYPHSMENGEDFWVRYYNGSSWTTVASYASGTSFTNGSFYSATINLSSVEYNLVSNAQFRIQCDASANADQIYVDQVTIKGIVGNGGTSTNSVNAIAGYTTFNDSGNDFASFDALLYPNPASDIININPGHSIRSTYRIMNSLGNVVAKGTIKNNVVDVSALQKGIYFIELTDEEETFTEKFIKR